LGPGKGKGEGEGDGKRDRGGREDPLEKSLFKGTGRVRKRGKVERKVTKDRVKAARRFRQGTEKKTSMIKI